jgi:rhodanese-related sulfurtransferase
MEHIDKKNIQAVGIGIALIVFVGVFFIGKSFWGKDLEGERSSDMNSDDSALVQRQTLTPSELQSKIARNEKVVLIDIRSNQDFLTKHIPKSRSFPSETLSNLQKEEGSLLVIIGSIADPSANELAQEILHNKSIDAWFLAGGFEEWIAQGYPIISDGDPKNFVDQSKVTFITKEALLPIIGSGDIFLLDTQSEENYKRKHIKGSTHISLNDLEKRTDEIPSNKRIIIYGENEFESFRAGVRLFDLNFFTAETLRGNDHLKTGSPFPLEP